MNNKGYLPVIELIKVIVILIMGYVIVKACGVAI